MVRYFSKKSCFDGPFDKQHGKRAQALLKSVSEHLYHINRLLPRQLSWKKSLFFSCRILGLLVNTLAADDKYPVLYRDNFTVPIRMQLLNQGKTFSDFFPAFLKYSWNFKHFLKKGYPHRFWCFRNYGLQKRSQINV